MKTKTKLLLLTVLQFILLGIAATIVIENLPAIAERVGEIAAHAVSGFEKTKGPD